MRTKYPYMNDSNFLLEMDTAKIQTQYVKITILNWKEEPVREIQGITTGGTLSLNGKSAIRRTMNLSALVTENQFANITEAQNLFSLNKKLFLEIGCSNNTNKYPEYPIIWYPQGTYVFNNCSLSHTTSGFSLSLQIKDKMCLLNGECGGTIPASTQFDSYETIDENGNFVITKPTIDQIITELVNHFGGEQLSKIIISDVDKRIKSVMRWTATDPVYMYHNGNNYFLTMDYETAAQYEYRMFSYGEDIGFVYTDFVYADELIGNAGDSVCTILDKIVSYLGGNYEYFYDIDGNFVFQEIKNYLNTTQATVDLNNMKNSDYKIDISKGKSVYDFSNIPIIMSIANNPQYSNIKNDYVVWGIRKTGEGFSLPIRYHLAIDKKPQIGNIYKVFFYEDPDDKITKAKMPVQYSSYAAIAANPGKEGVFYEDTSTGNVYVWEDGSYVLVNANKFDYVKTTDWRSELYLQGVAAEPLGLSSNYYYTELLNEWPKIYNLKDKKLTYYGTRSWTNNQINNTYRVGYTANWANQLGVVTNIGDLIYINVTNSTNQKKYLYVLEVINASTASSSARAEIISTTPVDDFTTMNYYEGAFYPEVLRNPSSIDYFLDFIDSEEVISQFSIENIGRRSIVKNSDNFNCVFEPEIPDFVLIETGMPDTQEKRQECEDRDQRYIQVDSNIFKMLAIGGVNNSCFVEVKNLLWQCTNYNSTVNLSIIPIFHLEPNTRVTMNSPQDGIYGDYMIETMSIPLTVSGGMSISAKQAQTKL